MMSSLVPAARRDWAALIYGPPVRKSASQEGGFLTEGPLLRLPCSDSLGSCSSLGSVGLRGNAHDC